ncbi:AB hydrolase-1 domain-containing protein [Mycena venus]|uniref:AB hydrolase-1 domain-containing protein n=1 Tax=Mycena venus TaxID=2733690 RepID=A0A8H6YXS3_9AGAR|nr:AB hydrolase-1 domain-containing protein [Mycena venus]
MPEVTLDTPTGTVQFNYVISTPTHTSTSAIDPALPTVLFLHPVYLGKIIYHPQFADRELRRFNLVAVDLRCHARTIGRAGKGYGRDVAARDVALLMVRALLPTLVPYQCRCSVVDATDPAISSIRNVDGRLHRAADGDTVPLVCTLDLRRIVSSLDREGVRHGETIEGGSMMGDAITGCLQLSVNGHPTETFDAILRVSKALMAAKWGVGSLDDFHVVSVDFFTLRQAYTVDAMRNIAYPVCLVHCDADIVYDLSTTNQVADQLRTAGIAVEVVEIPNAPHFGATTHSKEINTVFHNFLLSLCSDSPPPIPDQVVSPFKDQLIAAGWESDGEDSDLEYFI